MNECDSCFLQAGLNYVINAVSSGQEKLFNLPEKGNNRKGWHHAGRCTNMNSYDLYDKNAQKYWLKPEHLRM